MSDMSKRVIRLEEGILGKDTDQYRMTCFCYNLTFVGDEDLNEYAKSILECRECDPEVIKRHFAPIPTDAPSHLVKRAKALGDCRDIPRLDLKQVYQDILSWENSLKDATYGGKVNES